MNTDFHARGSLKRRTWVLLVGMLLIWPALAALGAGPALGSGSGSGSTQLTLDAKAHLKESIQFARRGDFSAAADAALSAAELFRQATDTQRYGYALVQLADVQQALGDYLDARNSLNLAQRIADQLGDKSMRAAVGNANGNVLVALKRPELAQQQLLQAIQDAQAAGEAALEASIRINLGNVYVFLDQLPNALASYEASAKLATDVNRPETVAQAYANAARTALDVTPPVSRESIMAYVELAVRSLKKMGLSHRKAYIKINLAQTLAKTRASTSTSAADQGSSDGQALLTQAYQQLQTAKAIAVELSDPRAEAYAQGYLGSLYEANQQYDQALTLTQSALFKAQQAGDKQSLYRWYWQKGRLYRALSKTDDAIGAYQQAVEILQTIRYQMAIGYGDPRRQFREVVGPVYMQLVDLLLEQAARSGSDTTNVVPILNNARQTVEQFKAAELRDYFQDQCVDALKDKLTPLDKISPSTVVVYPIVLEDRLEVLLSHADGSMQRYSSPVNAKRFKATVEQLRRLYEKRTTHEYRPHARQLYQWLITPFERHLGEHIQTLVFVPDGILRTVPMAALHDGERFLIEKYAIAITPGLELTDPRSLDRSQLSMLLGGLSQAVEDFPALSNVPDELRGIQGLFGGRVLLNDAFSKQRLQTSLENKRVSILHIATHGSFRGNAEDSFIMTYDGRLSLDHLADYVGLFKFRDQPLELLVLSACETAQGDDRAALGLSGVAVKAGARSAVGALWKVDDMAASALMQHFYTELQAPNASRAEALRRAQTKMLADLAYRHPGYWAAYILISNWL